MKKSTWLHLRVPFSFFLMPVFLFAAASAAEQKLDLLKFFLVFIVLHFFIYPASNAYNSYFDKDEGSIGGLENPPVVEKELYYTSLFFDLIGLLISLYVSIEFAIFLLIYGLASKAYSHPIIRLKKRPIMGWLTVGFFQGAFTWWLTYRAVIGEDYNFSYAQVSNQDGFFLSIVFPALLSSALLLGSYPMTQIYQHEEDKKRGDITLSLLLGIKGTFIFTAIFFAMSVVGFTYYFWKITDDYQLAIAFHLFLLPVLVYFILWAFRAFKNEKEANFRSTMRLNLLSSLCMNLFFGYYLIQSIIVNTLDR
jgi:1,4-dihydroxy-2-naphthoate octaprenyltransferase